MPLSHLRVAEIGSAAASACCARLFADFGTEMLMEEQLVKQQKRAAG